VVVVVATKAKLPVAEVAREAAALVATHHEQQLPVLRTLAVVAVAVAVLRIAPGRMAAPASSL
jgi:hypothetical protein